MVSLKKKAPISSAYVASDIGTDSDDTLDTREKELGWVNHNRSKAPPDSSLTPSCYDEVTDQGVQEVQGSEGSKDLREITSYDCKRSSWGTSPA